jgi:ABC-type Na+ efflux pump permease subunit
LLGPIFVREWLTVPRRARHYVVRAAYLGLLWVIGLTAWQVMVGWGRAATLGETARFGQLLFQVLAYVQLTLVLFFAALSGASAISQEKDRRTFLLLLLTRLRNREIVLGKLSGSLLQIGLLLVGSVPVLALVVLLGGVAPVQVAQVALILAATALAAGSLGGLMALWREQTFQAVALTVLCLVLCLCLARALALIPDAGAAGVWLDPYQALQCVLAGTGRVPGPLDPAAGFALAMVGLSVGLNVWGIHKLRSWNPRGEPVVQRELPDTEDEKDPARAHAAPGRARAVWSNPILWREIRTRAYGRRPLLVKAAYLLVFGLVVSYAVSWLDGPEGRVPFAAAYGLVPVVILSLLLVGAQAVSAVTSERDGHTLDLLLATDVTPREFIFGKLGGICFNTWEFVMPPLTLAGYYAGRGLLASGPRNLQAFVCVAGTLLILIAFTIVFGLHVGLRTANGRQALVNVLGTVFFLSVGTLVCIALIVINGRFEYQWSSFLFFLGAGVGGLWWALNGDRPSSALTVAAWVCPFALFYAVLNVLIGQPGGQESSEPFLPFLVIAAAFGLAIAAMLVPLLSEFDLALGRTGGGNE